MAKTREILMELLHEITSKNAAERERGADEVTDVHRSLSEKQVAPTAAVLVEACLAESDEAAREAELHALCELHEWHMLDATVLEPLKVLAKDELVGSQKEDWEELTSSTLS